MIGSRAVALMGRPFIKSLNCATFVSGSDRALAPAEIRAPTRAATPYNLFVKDKFQVTKQSNPPGKAPEVMKILAGQWKTLSEEQKVPYVKNSLIAKNERAAAVAKLSSEDLAAIKQQKIQDIRDKARKSKVKLASEHGKPKRPGNVITMFYTDRKGAYATPTTLPEANQVLRKIVAEWNALDEKTKAEFQARYVAAQAQYKVKVAAWEKNMIAQGKGDVLEKLKAPAIPKKVVKKAAPKLGRRKKLVAKKKVLKKKAKKVVKKKKPAKKAATAGAAKRKAATKVAASRKVTKKPAAPAAKKMVAKKK